MRRTSAKATKAARDPRFVAAAVALLSVALIASISWSSGGTLAGSGPKGVRGYVWDSAWNPVPGANVTVRMYDPVGTLMDTQYYDATEPSGFYSVTFGFDKWNDGYTIQVTAGYDVYSAVNSTIAVEGKPYQWVNATLGFVIPELGSGLVLGLTIASFAATVFAVGARRRGRA